MIEMMTLGVDAPSAGWQVALSLVALVCALVAGILGLTARNAVVVLLSVAGACLSVFLLWQGLALT